MRSKKEIKYIEHKGYIWNHDDNTVYIDITSEAQNVFGLGLVERVLIEVGDFYKDQSYGLERIKCEFFEDFIDNYANVDLWGKFEYSLNAKRDKTLQSLCDDEIDCGGISLIITFINGSMIELTNSEWGSIIRLN